jgi:hypothetical protein
VSAIVLRGDARRLPLPDASVDLIVTSPPLGPYFGLRSYTDNVKCYECIQMEYNGRDPRQAWPDYDAHVRKVHLRHYDGQIGSEASPREWLAALVECTREWVRVLKPSGSLFVNLGDKYSGAQGPRNGVMPPSLHDPKVGHKGGVKWPTSPRGERVQGFRDKSLLGLPWRYALACTDELGLILRRDIIWCLSGGARVYARTPTGDRPIMLRDLVRAYRPENVQLWNGERWTQVLGWNRSPDRDGALELELRTGERIGCTPGHRWPTQRGVIRADEVRIGDVIQTTRLPESDDLATPRALPLEDIGWLVGLYMAEGSRSEKMLQFAGHAREDARNERLRHIAEMYHGSAAVYRISENGVTCNVSGAVLLGIIDHYVGPGTALTKRFRKTIWQRGDAFLRAVMEGYLEGDGCYKAKDGFWQLNFGGNDELAADLRTMAARLGAAIRLRRCPARFNGRTFPAWRGTWRWIPSAHPRTRQDGEVVAIRASRAREFYDVGVADDPHLFALASGVLTHNSKPNGLPESVTDRCRSSHEYLFHLVKQPRYYAAVDEIREPHESPVTPGRRHNGAAFTAVGKVGSADGTRHTDGHPLGKLPGSVWDIPSQPLTVPAALGVDHFACVDAETEILTPRGWLRHDQLTAGEQVAGYDLGSNMARWTECTAVNRYDYDGDMIAVESRDISMRLTPNHRTLVQRMDAYTKRRNPVSVVRADELDRYHFIPRSATWEPSGDLHVGDRIAAVMGWVAAEGWYQGAGVWLSQSLEVNGPHVAEIDKLMPAAEIRTERQRVYKGRPWTEVTWKLGHPMAPLIQHEMPGKLLPWWLVTATEQERRAALDAFIAGDGHRRPDGRICIFQKHRHNLDVLQAVAVTLGYKTMIREGGGRFVLYLTEGGRSVTLRGTSGVGSKVRREHYKGTVWCPTTGTGTFIARRNGSVFVTGNSFPMELPRRCILGWSPPGICTGCGEGRRPVASVANVEDRKGRKQRIVDYSLDAAHGPDGRGGERWRQTVAITGYACACPQPDAPTRPALVLDPFGGTGTTALVAAAYGRVGVSVDLSGDYCRLARWRTADPAERAKALLVAKPPPVPDGQESLFDLEDTAS